MKKKILAIALALCLPWTNAAAYNVNGAAGYLSGYETRNTEKDKAYVKDIAYSYSDRYIVEEVKDIDLKPITDFYENMSAPLTLKEVDNGKANFPADKIISDELKQKMSLFKLFGGLGAYSAQFKPICAYRIHRDIYLVGGYSVYTKRYLNPMDAYWRCVVSLEDMTREVINYHTRMQMVDKFDELDEYINTDQSLKIFILKGNELNSVWEKTVDF